MLNRIENRTVVEQIVKQISDAIISGELKSGDKIPTELELIENLGVGRNSVREAIKMLSAMGILEIRRGDGTYINKEVSSSAFDSLVYSLVLEQSTKEQVLELREIIETDILEMAAAKAEHKDIEKVEGIMERFDLAYKAGDFREAARLDLEFHFALADITRNPLLNRIAKAVLQLFFSSIERTLKGYESSRGTTHGTHRKMLDILKNKDTASIKPVITESLKGWKNFI